ncbi:MAG: LacI family DNA-binding transcriptional regulator [Sphingomonas adhaesiva]|uniref:LacI family DNA-binding transcriptional regulator n=1 Tax=Sphingomonas adhaesiva TaxID=28212 RepID=UPI002FF6C634
MTRTRPTIADVARRAGVGRATVDRVLNARVPVRSETADRVLRAAREIGYHASHLIGLRVAPELPRRRLGFLLQKPAQSFYIGLGQALERAACASEAVRGVARLRYLDRATPAETAAAIAQLASEVDALAVVAIDHPTVAAAIHAAPVPVFTLLSEAADGARAGYLGVDNHRAGRVAAWLVGRTAPRAGKVALFVGSHRYRGHEQREAGFRAWFGEHGHGFTLLDTVANLDDPALAHEATLDLLKQHPDLVGITVAGGGMEGVVAALRDETAPGRLAVVCNEATPDSRAALAEGVLTAVIATPVERLAQAAVAAMVAATTDGALPPASATADVLLPVEIVIAEHL